MNIATHTIPLAVACVLSGVGADVLAGQRPSRLSDEQLTTILGSIDTLADTFRESLKVAIDDDPINGTDAEVQINQSATDLQLSARQLRERVVLRRSAPADIEDLLSRAAGIDQTMASHHLTPDAQRDWQVLRADIDTLAQGTGFTANWVGVGLPRTTDAAVMDLMRDIDAAAGRFNKSLEKALGPHKESDAAERTAIRRSAVDFATAAKQLRTRFEKGQLATGDVEDVLRRAGGLDHFVSSEKGRLSGQAESDWLVMRGGLDLLAQAYNIAWIWAAPRVPGRPAA